MKSRFEGAADLASKQQLLWWQWLALRCCPRKHVNKLARDIERNYARTHDPTERMLLTARELIEIIPFVALEVFNLALFLADILMFAVVVHSPSFAAVAGIVAGLTGLLAIRVHFSPQPKNIWEILIGSLVSMTLFVTVFMTAQWISTHSVSEPLRIKWMMLGIFGLMIPGLAAVFPNWKPEKWTPSYRAFSWAYFLNYVWMCAWVNVQKTNPQYSVHSVNFFLMDTPILFVLFTMWRNSSKGGLKTVQKNDMVAFSILGNKARIHQIKRQRGMMFDSVLCEVVLFGLLAIQFVGLVFLNPNFDRLRAGSNFTASLVMFAVWRYIRQANRRADALLAEELDRLMEEDRTHVQKPFEIKQPSIIEDADTGIFSPIAIGA